MKIFFKKYFFFYAKNYVLDNLLVLVRNVSLIKKPQISNFCNLLAKYNRFVSIGQYFKQPGLLAQLHQYQYLVSIDRLYLDCSHTSHANVIVIAAPLVVLKS